MKNTAYIVVLLCFTLSCKDDKVDGVWIEPESTYEVLEISTDFGEMYVHLYDSTPLHKANFDSLTRAGFYDSTEFHRCVKDFVIQGGSPTSKDNDRTNDWNGSPGYTIPAEIDSSKFKHVYGSLAAARTNNPEKKSSGSQFYIVNNENGLPHLDGLYTTFGIVISGKEVAKTIAAQPQDSSNNLPDSRIKMIVQYRNFTQSELDEKGIVIP